MAAGGSHSNYGGSRKTRLLAKAQSECMLNLPTKQEPGTDYQRGDYQNCTSACKEPQPYYVNSTAAGHTQDQQQLVYSSCDKRVSWAAPAAHVPTSHGSSRRHSAVPVVNLREYNMHKEYVQPPAAHSTRDLTIPRDQHLLAPSKSWAPQTLHQGYRYVENYLY